jgi:hypothetical protein
MADTADFRVQRPVGRPERPGGHGCASRRVAVLPFSSAAKSLFAPWLAEQDSEVAMPFIFLFLLFFWSAWRSFTTPTGDW